MLAWYDRQMCDPDNYTYSELLLLYGMCWLTMNSCLKSMTQWDAVLHTA